MAAPVNTPLSVEPTAVRKREKAHLPPKSYADAVELDPPVTDARSQNGTNDTNGAVLNGSTNDTTSQEPTPKKAAVLRIVDTGAPAAKENQDEKPKVERQLSQQEYSVTGLDDTPKTPPMKQNKNENRKSGSKSSSVSQDNVADDEKRLASEDNEHKTTGPQVDYTVIEQVEGEQNGHRLLSGRAAGNYEKQLKRDEEEEPKEEKEKLFSGKQAGKRWEQSAIRFAPMNVPLRRRLQTLVVLLHTITIALSVSIFCFLCAIPLFWPILIPYMIYCMSSNASTSGTLSHRSEFLRSLPVWSLFAQYFPARLHRTQELSPTRKYIFGYHPHGIISMGCFAAFATESMGFSQLFPGIKNTLLTLESNFRIPLYRDYALAMGLASVSRESCENLLSKGGLNNEGMGRAVTIVVGGARESLDAQPRTLRLVLKRRKGFVKLAIRTGADLVPVLGFGENDIYDQFQANDHPKVHKFQLLVKKLLGFTIPLFHARGVFNYDVGLHPYRRPLNIVVGRPIRVVQNSKPSQEDIDRVHEEYIQELERLWNTWKDDFAPDREEELSYVE